MQSTEQVMNVALEPVEHQLSTLDVLRKGNKDLFLLNTDEKHTKKHCIEVEKKKEKKAIDWTINSNQPFSFS